MKKLLILIIAGLLVFTCGCRGDGEFPSKNINGIVQWGAGGGTDTLMRPLASLAGEKLGTSIVVRNMTGGTGSVATKYVYDAKADGYNLLMGAENPALYPTLGILDLSYDDFDCVFLLGDEQVGIAVGKSSGFDDLESLINAATASPGSIKLSTTGVGGLPWEVGAFITDVTGATFNQIPYDSDASARTAVINGECDFTVCKIQSGLASHNAGEIKYIAMFTSERVQVLPDVPTVCEKYPGFEKYLPWGPFYGIFVKKDTPDDIKATLGDAFSSAANDAGYQELLDSYNINYLGYVGDAASEYIARWQKNTIDALKSSGAVK